MKYVSAEAYAVEAFARRPAIKFSRAARSRSSATVMRLEPRFELIHDFKYRLFQTAWRRILCKESAYPKMRLGTQFFRNQ